MDDAVDLQRFVDAQDGGGTYACALAELHAGRKRTHWMWFVFPQLAGLGRSETARRYAISGRTQAHAYLEHPVLGPRLVEATRALLALDRPDPIATLGEVDAMKLRSSMTLFEAVAPGDSPFRELLAIWFAGDRDLGTIELLDLLERP